MSRQIPNHTVESIQKIVNANPSLKKLWKPRLKIFKSKNFSLDPFKLEAFSYGWWQFVIKKGKRIFFNDFQYSTTTRRHQRHAKDILEALGFRDLVVVHTATSLNRDLTYDAGLYEEVAELIVKARYGRVTDRDNRYHIANKLFKNANMLCPNGRTLLNECVKRAESRRQQRLCRERERREKAKATKLVEALKQEAFNV